jgi:RES domain-containing protein
MSRETRERETRRGARWVSIGSSTRFAARRISVEETECQGKIARTLDQC